MISVPERHLQVEVLEVNEHRIEKAQVQILKPEPEDAEGREENSEKGSTDEKSGDRQEKAAGNPSAAEKKEHTIGKEG